jgi:hypothetical protein
MSEHQKQTECFKAMLQTEESWEHRQLRGEILTAERNERCVRRAILKIGMLMAIVFLCGLYTAVIMPEVILDVNHSLRKVFQILVLGSCMTLLTYVGFWFYYRAVLFQVHTHCRRFMMSDAIRFTESVEFSEESEGNAELVLTEHAI